MRHPQGLGFPFTGLCLRPSKIGSWKFGCGTNLPSLTSTSTNPTPYRPIPPTTTTPLTAPTTPPTPTTSYTSPTTSIVIRTATGGTKVVAKRQNKTSSPPPTYVCDGMGCAFGTNSPYKFMEHHAKPHTWKAGSQNWCFNKAKALAHGNKPLGIQASSPTVFPSMDIRVKKGELPPNVIKISSNEEPTLLPSPLLSPPPNITPTTPNTTLTTPTPTLTPTTPISTTPTQSGTSNSTASATLYFPVSYFLWKRRLPPPAPTPIIPPWYLFPRPRRNKVTSSSHLKWDRRLPNQTAYCWGVNDPKLCHSSHPVTLKHGVGVPRFQENGTWAHYSNLLVPKSHYQNKHPWSNSNPSNYKVKPKGRIPRPKSGQNTAHKGHGLSQLDNLNGLGKTIPSELPCRRQTQSSSQKTQPLTTSTFHCPPTISTTNTYSTSSTTPVQVPYPSSRTKWTRPLGGTLKGGGPTTALTISLMGNVPYNSKEDSRMVTITCQDSVMECSLLLIEHHSNFVRNLLQECGNCR